MNVDFHVIIPARFQSSRYPGKLLQDLAGQTIIERVYRQALKAKPKSIIIATDHEAIFRVATDIGAIAMMTESHHQTGTDRIAEIVGKLDFLPNDIIVNVQGDEPLIAPALIRQVATVLQQSDAPMATLCWPIEEEAACQNPNIVKVVRDSNHYALYFSRSTIPYNRDGIKNTILFRHIGLYAYRSEFLINITRQPACALEQVEALEQLRALWAGYRIKVEEACECPLQDINTEEDLVRARDFFLSSFIEY